MTECPPLKVSHFTVILPHRAVTVSVQTVIHVAGITTLPPPHALRLSVKS